jgi:hypothetical protein
MWLAVLAHALLPRLAFYLTVVATLLASIVRQGFIYLVCVHRLTPIESSMRFDTMLAFT